MVEAAGTAPASSLAFELFHHYIIYIIPQYYNNVNL